MAKLFMVGFPKDIQEIELVEMFSLYGTVNTVTIITDQVTGDSRGYGFITMTDDAGAVRAIAALDGALINGRIISVRFADEKHTKQAPPPKSSRLDTIRPRRPRKL